MRKNLRVMGRRDKRQRLPVNDSIEPPTPPFWKRNVLEPSRQYFRIFTLPSMFVFSAETLIIYCTAFTMKELKLFRREMPLITL